jgi:hypothetical protein
MQALTELACCFWYSESMLLVTSWMQALTELACCFWYRYLGGQHYSLNVSISIRNALRWKWRKRIFRWKWHCWIAFCSFKMFTFLFFQKCYMVDGIPVDILNGGSILFFQNADISILSEMFRWTVNLRIYLATLFFQRCILHIGGSILFFQNADISILSEMYMVDSISVDILSNSILSEMRFRWRWRGTGGCMDETTR